MRPSKKNNAATTIVERVCCKLFLWNISKTRVPKAALCQDIGPKRIKPVVAVADFDTHFDFVWGLERESKIYGDIHL